jgi:hypothetical protein
MQRQLSLGNHGEFVLTRNKAKAVSDYVYVHARVNVTVVAVGFYFRAIEQIYPDPVTGMPMRISPEGGAPPSQCFGSSAPRSPRR